MRCCKHAPILLLLLLLAACTQPQPQPQPSQLTTLSTAHSQWVTQTADGQLTYKPTPTGDHIMDFSYAGYMGGGVAIPNVPVIKTLSPSTAKDADDAPAIQAALDDAAKLPVSPAGIRGAILLTPGDYHLSKTLTISNSGITLRGSGIDKTILHLTGLPHSALTFRGGQAPGTTGDPIDIAASYIPAGSSTLPVTSVNGLTPGQTIFIARPATKAWVHFMGMDTLVRDGKSETWVGSGDIIAERTIKAIYNNTLTLDIPLPDSYDPQYLNPPGTVVMHATPDNRLSQCGLENLTITAPGLAVGISDAHYSGISFSNAKNCWAQNLKIADLQSAVGIGASAKQITIQDIQIPHTTASVGAAKPADLSFSGSQTLMQRITGNCDNTFYLATGARVTGPNVLLNCTFHGNGHIQPHQRWAVGLLLDNCHVPDSGIDLMNRGQMGSGHGWTIAWSVAWNCSAKTFLIQNPPGATNWAIGCTGKMTQAPMPFLKTGPTLPEGTYDSINTPVAPTSLYLAQLAARLGPTALKNIGY